MVQYARTGPFLMIANHPYGIIDGLVMWVFVSKERSDFFNFTHETSILQLNKYILPIDLMRMAGYCQEKYQNYSKGKGIFINQGLLIIFPSGSVLLLKILKLKQEMIMKILQLN